MISIACDTGKLRSNTYIIHNIATGTVRTLDVGLLKKYNHDPLMSDFEVAMGDEQRYVVEAIVKHRITGNKKTKKGYEFLVKFEGYPPEWQTYHNLTDIVVFQEYCRDKRLHLFVR